MMPKNRKIRPVGGERLGRLRKVMRRYLWLVVAVPALTYFGSMTARSLMVVKGIHEIRTEHFVLSYDGIRQAEAEKVANHLEGTYSRILKSLDAPHQDIVHAYIHASQANFNQATGLVGSSAIGTSRGPKEFHIIWTNWYNSIFPANPLKNAVHEFTHCVQLNILVTEALENWNGDESEDFDTVFEDRFAKHYPQWLWEAISIYLAEEVNFLSVNYGMWTEPSLESLNTGPQIYNVGYTIIEYVVKTWGEEKLPSLIRSYGDLETVLDIDAQSFEANWKMFVQEHY